jgi:hypothetical protein
MRDKAPKLALLLKRLLAAVNDVKKAIQNQTTAINTKREHDTDQNYRSPEVRAEVHFPKAIETNNTIQKGKEYTLQKASLGVSCVTLCVATIYAALTLGLFCETREANRIARDALYIGHRPWVGLAGAIQFPEQPRFEIYPTSRMVHLSIKYLLQNYGTAPALKTSSFAMIFFERGPLKRPDATMNQACSFADTSTAGNSVIFPAQPVAEESNPGTAFDPTAPLIGQIWITICTAYGDDTGKIHHSKTWAVTEPAKGAQPIIAVPGNILRYYPVSEARIFDEAVEESTNH